MRKSLFLWLVAAVSLAALPAGAQRNRPRSFVRPPAPRQPVFPRHVFVPGFGFTRDLRSRFPVGLGFDAHHFSVLNRHRRFHGGFFGGATFGRNFFGGGFFPFVNSFPFVSSSSTVVVVPQQVPVHVPVPVIVQDSRFGETPVVVPPAGLPANWSEVVRFVRPSYPTQQAPLAQLTLLVLEDHTIYAVTDYWLEDGRIFYVTSTGRQRSVPVRDLDWETTAQLNAERGVEFVLRSR